jgi:hypothetical protein
MVQMAKRNDAATAIDNLANVEAEKKHREAIAKLPLPETVDAIAWEDVYSDHEFNVRDKDDAYTFDANKDLYESLRVNGLIKRDLMAFSYQETGENAGKLLVLAGNLRHAMMGLIRESEIERRLRENEPVEPESLPFAHIHGLVYRGLTREQETLVMADHALKKDLNEYERCKEIGEFLHKFPMADGKAAIHFGMNKSQIQRYRMRYAMPTVMAEFKVEKSKDKDKPYVKVGQEDLTALYTAIMIDRDGGAKFREEGPNFKAAWAKLRENPDVFKKSGQKAANNTDPRQDSDVLSKMVTSVKATYGDTPEIIAIRDALRWASGLLNDDGTPVVLNKVMEDIKVYCDGLRDAARTTSKSKSKSHSND